MSQSPFELGKQVDQANNIGRRTPSPIARIRILPEAIGDERIQQSPLARKGPEGYQSDLRICANRLPSPLSLAQVSEAVAALRVIFRLPLNPGVAAT